MVILSPFSSKRVSYGHISGDFVVCKLHLRRLFRNELCGVDTVRDERADMVGFWVEVRRNERD